MGIHLCRLCETLRTSTEIWSDVHIVWEQLSFSTRHMPDHMG